MHFGTRSSALCVAIVAVTNIYVQQALGWSFSFLAQNVRVGYQNHPRKMATPFYLSPVSSSEGDKKEHDKSKPIITHHNTASSSLPKLDQWQVTSDGSVAGTISNHPKFDSGHLITTSEVDTADICALCEDFVITTVTGSQYILGRELLADLEDWKLTEDGAMQGNVYGRISFPDGDFITTSSLAKPHDKKSIAKGCVVTTKSGSRYRLGEPMRLPHLQQWKRLEGGSIAGIVTRHHLIPDGELITTSPLVEYDESNGIVLVTTASGSQYELGEAHGYKEQQLEAAAEAWGEEAAAIFGEADENEDNSDIESVFVPKAPETSPPVNVTPKLPETPPPVHALKEIPQIPQTPPPLHALEETSKMEPHFAFAAKQRPQPPVTSPKELVEELAYFNSMGVGLNRTTSLA